MTPASLATCLWWIQQRAADRPIPAIDLAAELSIGGNRENKRRKVRELVFELRKDAELKDRIGAGAHGYYWNGTTAEMLAWRERHRHNPLVSLWVARKVTWDGSQARLGI